MKKVITLILALIMVLTMFVACTTDKPENPAESSSSNNSGNNEQPADSSSNGGSEEEEPNLYEEIGLPDGLNYNDAEFNIMHWKECRDEFEVTAEQNTGDPILDAIYKRNLYTEQLLGVDLVFTHNEYTGNTKAQMGDWCNKLENAMSDPSTPVDIFASYSRVLSVAMVRGLCQDISVYDNIDLSKPWWPSAIIDELAIDDKLYIFTGELSTNLLHNMYAVFFNKSLVDQHGLPDLYTLVDNKEWTVDKMMEVTSGVYEDLDGEDGKTAGDFFGLSMDWWCSDCLVLGSDFKILESTTEGNDLVKVTDEFFGEVFGNFVNKLGDWAISNDVFDDTGYTGLANTSFREGRSMFTINVVSNGFSLQETDIDYGILPAPLRDGDQQEYLTGLGNSYSNYGMARYCSDGERAAAVISTLGYYGMTLTTPAIFEVTFKGKFSKDPKMLEMFDTIREGVCFDMGYLHMRELDSINDKPTNAIAKNLEWSVAMGTFQQNALKKLLKIFNDNLNTLVNS